MARPLPWSDLKTGLIGAAVVAALVFGILFFARVGQLRGDTGTLYVYSDDADGVLPGTEVWLSGEKVGQVKRIRFRPVTTDTTRRLSIETLIMANKMSFIRRDARVDIRPGGNLIGTPVIYISGGTSKARALTTGDTLVTVSNSAFKPLGMRAESLGIKLSALGDTTKKLIDLIASPKGTLGALQKYGMPGIPSTSGAVGNLMDKFEKGNGSVALMARGDVKARLTSIMASKDSITALLASGKGSLGRFKNDSTLFRDIAQVQARVDSLKQRFSGNGFIARSRSDSSLTIEMAKMNAELAALMADLKKNPGRFISF
jgi:phospholipid/cholesterol/gamma-HCH transport system substrate-binding protein